MLALWRPVVMLFGRSGMLPDSGFHFENFFVVFRKPELVSALFVWIQAAQEATDIVRGGFNLLTSLLQSHVFSFRSQQCRFSDHDGELIIDGMQNLLRRHGGSQPVPFCPVL